MVIKELEPERFRRSGLLVPSGSNEPPPQHGIVLAVGQGQDWWEHVGFRMHSIERDAFTPATGYADGIEIDGIPLRDRVWLELPLR